uniref:ORF111 n=1 Tax=Hoilungia sp. H23 TaxID=2781605 RepID=A0A7U3NG47_9METZ|nr:ORF111 [Hoilungia sp. H23]
MHFFHLVSPPLGFLIVLFLYFGSSVPYHIIVLFLYKRSTDPIPIPIPIPILIVFRVLFLYSRPPPPARGRRVLSFSPFSSSIRLRRFYKNHKKDQKISSIGDEGGDRNIKE